MNTIADTALFADLSHRARQRVDSLSTEIGVAPGHRLTTERTVGREFGVLVSGAASVEVDGEIVAELGPGDHYGEMALLNEVGGKGRYRAATVTTTERSVVSVLSIDEFRTLVVEFPEVADAIRDTALARSAANRS